jgi:hypothetical protein
VVEAHPTIDILGGEVVNLSDFSVHDYSRLAMVGHPALPRFQLGSRVGGLTVYAKVPNFFLCRTETVRAVSWTEAVKIMVDNKFFWRAWGILRTVFDENLRVLHARNPFDRSSPERAANVVSASVRLRQIYC